MGVVSLFPVVDRQVRRHQVISSPKLAYYRDSPFTRGKRFVGEEPGQGTAYSRLYESAQFLVMDVAPIPSWGPRALDVTLKILKSGEYHEDAEEIHLRLDDGEYPSHIAIRGSMELVRHFRWVRKPLPQPAS